MKLQSLIGVACREGQHSWVREFFEFFKTPWEFYRADHTYPVVISTSGRPPDLQAQLFINYGCAEGPNGDGEIVPSGEGIFVDCDGISFPIYGKLCALTSAGTPMVRALENSAPVAFDLKHASFREIRSGYDLFEEIEFLLAHGQPEANAAIPTLDIHVSVLRNWILRAGIPLIEIPPVPPGHEFIACLTHDVDFIRIADHKLDHTLWGFIRRASLSSLWGVVKGETSWRHCVRNIKALVSLPAVYLGLSEDFWLRDFDQFLELERDMKATFFFIPFKGRPGDKVMRPHRKRRAAAYDVTGEKKLLHKLESAGNEIGVHGIDAWHSAEKGREERSRIAQTSGRSDLGVRMHWLCFDAASPRVLEEAGFNYDSTCGYNETVGYRAGTHQVFRPYGTTHLLELPLHIQDTALFYPGRAGSFGNRAWDSCETLILNALKYGGVLTLLWHTRSMAPERQWDGFYIRLLNTLKNRRVWFGTANQVVQWFRGRRSVSFRSVRFSDQHVQVTLDCVRDVEMKAGVTVRIHVPDRNVIDHVWTGERVIDVPLNASGRWLTVG